MGFLKDWKVWAFAAAVVVVFVLAMRGKLGAKAEELADKVSGIGGEG